ncbi:hypothetical protein VISI1226_17545 [Vibrio sinaloensis DSM 21326]|uniref:Uncharacterized protein n=1 Tax=Vibrio sinaloensis DSM 21326 TaxID=945550 RepID=E8M8G5_PHOS4|nr:hypothetical protein VISI1226_17545 [Vibrio sinaloensis DSM 21326]
MQITVVNGVYVHQNKQQPPMQLIVLIEDKRLLYFIISK